MAPQSLYDYVAVDFSHSYKPAIPAGGSLTIELLTIAIMYIVIAVLCYTFPCTFTYFTCVGQSTSM